jgi:hypothetical protein
VSTILFEECARFSRAMARRHLGRQALLEAYHRGQPIIWPGVPLPLALAADTVYLPWKGSVYDPGSYTERLWLKCPRCFQRALVLYGVAADVGLPTIACQKCFGLRYYSQHCHGNLWYKHVVMPMRRLKRLDGRLACHPRQDIRQRLLQEKAQLLGSLTAWQHWLQPHNRRPHSSPFQQSLGWRVMTAPSARKRPYRSLQYV